MVFPFPMANFNSRQRVVSHGFSTHIKPSVGEFPIQFQAAVDTQHPDCFNRAWSQGSTGGSRGVCPWSSWAPGIRSSKIRSTAGCGANRKRHSFQGIVWSRECQKEDTPVLVFLEESLETISQTRSSIFSWLAVLVWLSGNLFPTYSYGAWPFRVDFFHWKRWSSKVMQTFTRG